MLRRIKEDVNNIQSLYSEILKACEESGNTVMVDLYNKSWKDYEKNTSYPCKPAFEKIIKIYMKDNNVNINEFNVDDFIDWLELEEHNHLGALVFNYFEDFKITDIRCIYECDPKFKNALDKVFKDIPYIDENGIDLCLSEVDSHKLKELKREVIRKESDLRDAQDDIKYKKDFGKLAPQEEKRLKNYEKDLQDAINEYDKEYARVLKCRTKADPYTLLRALFKDGVSYYDEITDKEVIDYDNLNKTVYDVYKVYKSLNESLLKEFVENEIVPAEEEEKDIETDSKEEVKDQTTDNNSTETSDVSSNETSEETINVTADSQMVKSLVTNLWDIVDNINSVKISFNSKNEQVENILNSIIDDMTINIGMLNKVLQIIDVTSNDLLKKGEEKAEDIIKA